MSAKAKMREPKSCLDHRVFNFKRGCFCYESNGVEQTRTGTSKVENSTQVLSCQLRFVHTRQKYIYIKTRKLSAAPPMTPIFAKRNFLHQNEGNQSNNNPVLRSIYTCVFALHFRTRYAYPKNALEFKIGVQCDFRFQFWRGATVGRIAKHRAAL